MISTMRIESLANAPDRAGRYRLVLEDGTLMRLYKQTVQDFSLYTGMELSEQQLQQLKVAAGEMSAKMRAVRIVAASSISKRDLQQRLIQKGEDPQHAKKAVAWMEDLSLVDDTKTAEQVVARCVSKGYGLARAKQALYDKRIPKHLWDDVLCDYPDQTDAIEAYLRAHLTSESDQKEIKRTVDALLRRGHSYPQIRRALQQITLDFEEFTED